MAHETQTGVCINLEGWDDKGDDRKDEKGEDTRIPMVV